MIKAILMIYVFIPILVFSLFNDDKIIIAACMAGAFGCGMFCFYFISKHVKEICK